MIIGARQGEPDWLQRLVARGMARDLCALVVPGLDVARARGLNLGAAGLRIAITPRHANVVLLVGPLPNALADAAVVLYAQMMRPRAVLALGGDPLPALPADVATPLSQQDLLDGVAQLRTALAQGAFGRDPQTFHATVLEARTEYTCPMHPEVVHDEPGSCPKCGMTLVPREAQAASPAPARSDHGAMMHAGMASETGVVYTCPMHPEVVHDEPGSCPKCGMTLMPRETQAASPEPAHVHDHDHDDHETMAHATMAGEVSDVYTCPMHPEVERNAPGACPKCGMTLVPRETQAASPAPAHSDHGAMMHAGMASETGVVYTCPMHLEVERNAPGACPKCGMTLVPQGDQGAKTQGDINHPQMDHADMAFMSMVDVTKDLPRSPDGLQMDWIEVPFGPVFPGLPSGLLLNLTLDGDAVAKTQATSLVGGPSALPVSGMEATRFIEQLGALDPLAPEAYRLLACRGWEAAGQHRPDDATLRGRIAALERERIASHLGWLAMLGRQIGFAWLEQYAARMQQTCLGADLPQLLRLRPALRVLEKRLRHTPLLRARLSGIGIVTASPQLRGPVARAAGMAIDARTHDATYTALSFETTSRAGGDALDRLHVRLDEIHHSLVLIQSAGMLKAPAPGNSDVTSGEGQATVETPRGEAHLHLRLHQGRVMHAQLDTPSTHHLSLLPALLAQQELGDALTTVCSLDLSPWEVVAA